MMLTHKCVHTIERSNVTPFHAVILFDFHSDDSSIVTASMEREYYRSTFLFTNFLLIIALKTSFLFNLKLDCVSVKFNSVQIREKGETMQLK